MSNAIENKDNKLTFKGKLSEYQPEYCDEIIQFFNREPYKTEKLIKYNKDGSSEEKLISIPCDLPTLEGFATSIGVSIGTIHEWCKENDAFLDAIQICKTIQY